MVISHEMGHLFGVMAHSKRCVDVTSYYGDGRGARCSIRGGSVLAPGVEYRSTLPTACDIQRCVALSLDFLAGHGISTVGRWGLGRSSGLPNQ